ncbi:unnamed protein product, partial [Medioppia subpectinata]
SYIIDNNIFRLHYKATVVILIGCSLLVTARQYIGDPIDCLSGDKIPTEILDSYCWIHTTFSIESAWKLKVGTEVVYPGVDNSARHPNSKRVYHAYYQWVCFMLAFQAMLFYIPRYLWKSYEGHRIKNLCLDLNFPIARDPVVTRNNRALLVDYLYHNLNNHNIMFRMYVTCEVLNFLNVILQMVLMDRFLGGEFTSYGWDVLSFTEWDSAVRFDPMVFPRLTKCTFHQYGPSGDVQKHDALCILPINIINEKIYIFLWFWFYMLAILGFMALVYRTVTILMPQVRYLVIQSRCLANYAELRSVCNQCSIGDWFVLYLLCKNFDSINFKDMIVDFDRRLTGKTANGL